jgi:hypothetical protein
MMKMMKTCVTKTFHFEAAHQTITTIRLWETADSSVEVSA